MLKLLLNANLSPETAAFLRSRFGFDVRCLVEERLGALTDEEVAAIAHGEGRVVVTSDLDFGQRYHFAREPRIGTIVLRLEDQTVEHTKVSSRDSLCRLVSCLPSAHPW